MSEPNAPSRQKGGTSRSDEREVTDPITHHPITIHNADSVELEQIPPPPTADEQKKIRQERGADTKEETNARHVDMEAVVREATEGKWWEDPIGDQRRTRIHSAGVASGSAAAGAFSVIIVWYTFRWAIGRPDSRGLGWWGFLLAPFVCIILGLGVGISVLVLNVFQEKPKAPSEPLRQGDGAKTLNKDETSPESAEWLNSFLNSLWPIVNPSLFVSMADILEDAMQATLPKLVYGVRVADIGQGSEAVRILGVRWLDAGSAAKDVDGMKAEEGDFINMEVALAYRAKETTAQGIRSRSGNAHLLMEFWVAGGMRIPVWVELTGFLATMRVRLQLTPNPPFLSLMTLSMLGLPKVTMKCTPLAKNFLNVMDVPGLSGWLQKSINLAVEEYVAPRSLMLDLKTLLMGRPKMDTDALGVILITIRSAEEFRTSVTGGLIRTAESNKGDMYVTLGWSKWGKPLWSTRIIASDHPVWEETTALLVTPSEINAQEGLQLQLWDSDRFTVDDLVGNVHLDLKTIMNSDETVSRMSARSDGLVSDRMEPRKGTIHWECGYFAKTSFDQHLKHKKRNAEEIRANIEEEAENKLREAKARDSHAEDGEVEQQKKEDMKEKSDEIIATSRPTEEWPSGILSIRIEQISGLEVEKIRESGVSEGGEGEEGEDLPSAYCSIIINQQKVYRTRTKMKNNNPFYDAGTERFIRDWRTTDVIISVRDGRLHEANPVIGIVVLPLAQLFKHNSQFTDSLPLVGGIGYGRMRLSATFRSVQLQLPKNLLGWDIGTIDISPVVKVSSDLPPEYQHNRLTFRTLYGKGKMTASDDGWTQKHNKPIRLPVKKRYASCLVIEFRKHAVGPDVTSAFAVLWFKDIPDDEDLTLTLPVRKNADKDLDAARKNASPDIGEQIGSIQLSVRFWPGLSGYHKPLADHDSHMSDVMEVLDHAEESQKASEDLLEEEHSGEETSSGEEDSDDGEEAERREQAPSKDDVDSSHTSGSQRTFETDEPRKGPFKNFRQHKGELHRKHRGLMQWKAARNVAWIGRGVEHKATQLSDKVKGVFKHEGKDDQDKIEKEAS
jgi:hypothetical protein